MKDDVFYSMIFSICLLMALAYIIGKWDFMKKILRQRGWGKMDPEQRRTETFGRQVQLGLIMGMFCVVSNTIGFLVDGSIPNSRVIGAMSAGLLGGPVSGFLAAGIGAVHRYLGEPDRISTTACCLATLLQGGLGSLIWYGHKKRIDYSSGLLFLSTMLAECLHMGLIYLLSFPRTEALDILHIIAVPMVLINPVGMVLFFAVIRDAIRQADREEAAGVSRSLRLTERCTPYLQVGGDAEVNAAEILKIIVEEEECEGAALIRDDHFLARTEAFQEVVLTQDHLPAILTRCRTQGDVAADTLCGLSDPFAALSEQYVILAAPVPAFTPRMDYLVVLVRKNIYSSEADQSYVSGLARFFTIQLTLGQLEEQKHLLRKAELQTLQSQINPHFLFNALNTISFFCREKPERARELLMDLSTYFRNTLQDVDSMVTLGEELVHVQAYLSLEQARFEDRLQVSVEAEENQLGVLVPNLILQPLVENAIRHGAMKQPVGRVMIRIHGESGSTVIEVCDNGGGVPEEVVRALARGGGSVGGRIGLLNVQKRLLQIWGEDAGLTVTREAGWTHVSTRIAQMEGVSRAQAV
ncbi:MAG: histidine kinase [Lachnospiraceae bacterium]|nr:histidine kinase [Lachnospiraceae bacterium]